MRTIAIVLTPSVEDSQVIVDGQDISTMCVGVEVKAMVGDTAHVTLHLIGRVELLADVNQLNCIYPPDKSQTPE